MLIKRLRTEDEEIIAAAIALAEKKTSGEIRVHIETTGKGKEPLDRATELFFELGMQQTKNNTGVLIYVCLRERKLAIIGDKGINKKVPADFWDQAKSLMIDHFVLGKMAEGICEAVNMAGEQLSKYFPREENDTNELPDEISGIR